MQKKKIMFFDIDGTLISFKNNGQMTDKMIETLHKLRANGIYIGIATGRQTTVYETKFKDITPMDFIIGSNGREVLIDGEKIYSEHIGQETLERLIAFDNKYNVGLMFSSRDDGATYNPATEMGIHYLHALGLGRPKQDKNFYLNNDVLQAMIYCDETTENIFKESFPELKFIRHNNNGIDVVKAGPLKEKGIEVVLEHFGFGREDALAFGDGLNDLGMFEYIDGICLGVAHLDLVELAQKQIGTVENDGIYHYLLNEGYLE